ncbi:hypothetical protein J9303_00420 [Bacillaceae bacterium Marseille-Q3522]|nr:hypothetical protein [Bacillaceae bacterium Marseille-Q3522]
MKYRKKPVVVEAEPYRLGLEDGFKDAVEQIGPGIRGVRKIRKPYINTLEGEMIVSPGDWIITGVKKERYVCKPDIFELTYEKVIES